MWRRVVDPYLNGTPLSKQTEKSSEPVLSGSQTALGNPFEIEILPSHVTALTLL